MKTFTAFCQQANGEGCTTWIESVQARTVEAATNKARRTCAKAWDCSPKDVHVLGIAAGDVEILSWTDIER